MNTWPNGERRAISQIEHEAHNANHYPGTRQMCVDCDEPTGLTETTSLMVGEYGPLCNECYDLRQHQATDWHNEQMNAWKD